MEQLYKDFLSIIKCGLLQQRAEVTNATFDWKGIVSIAHAHKIHMTLYYGIIKGGFEVPQKVLEFVKNKALFEIAFSMRQRAEMEKVFKIFEENEIEFLPLKGVVIKELYPAPDMRIMSDVDVLIKESQYKKIEELLKKNDYLFDVESDHEIVWKKKNGTLCLELHKHLAPTYNKDLYDYYGDGWKMATKSVGSHYYMSDEDFFIYVFSHFAKHYRDSGIGIRHIIDIWVCLKESKLNHNYIEAELKKLSLYDFYLNVKKTLDVWFNDEKETNETEIITKWIFESGVYGTAENNAVSRAARNNKGDNKSKGKVYFQAFFPTYENMGRKYPILKKAPVLLPFAWIWRLVSSMFSHSHRLRKIKDDFRLQTDENIAYYKELLNKVGLNI